MRTRVSRGVTQSYKYGAKPLLFRFKPDGVHSRTLQLTSRVQRSEALLRLLRKNLAYENPERLGHNVHGIWFENPIGLSAGFDKNFELPLMMRAIGFGFMEGGSVTHLPCAGNPRPWFHRLPRSKSLVVHAGLANQGVEAVVHRLLSYSWGALAGFPLNISVALTNNKALITTEDQAIDDFMSSLWYIRQARAGQIVTLNISCPNTYQGEPFTVPRMLERLLVRVDKLHLRQPVFIKMPNHLPWPAFKGLLDVIVKHNVAGVTISNLAKREAGVELQDALPDSVRGGLSGKPTWKQSNDLIRRTYKSYGSSLTIIGVGGVFSAEDAYIKIRLGASLVELITGMIFEGPALIGQINKGLAELLERDGFDNVKQAVGADVR